MSSWPTVAPVQHSALAAGATAAVSPTLRCVPALCSASALIDLCLPADDVIIIQCEAPVPAPLLQRGGAQVSHCVHSTFSSSGITEAVHHQRAAEEAYASVLPTSCCLAVPCGSSLCTVLIRSKHWRISVSPPLVRCLFHLCAGLHNSRGPSCCAGTPPSSAEACGQELVVARPRNAGWRAADDSPPAHVQLIMSAVLAGIRFLLRILYIYCPRPLQLTRGYFAEVLLQVFTRCRLRVRY